MRIICKLDIEKYKCVTEDITTDEVIITDERIQHIKDHHPNDYERYFEYMEAIIADPDYIIEAFDSGKEIFKTVLRIVTVCDESDYKNSIITFMKINVKEWNRLIRNKKILYKAE